MCCIHDGYSEPTRRWGHDQTLPTSNVFFACEDLSKTYEELTARGVEFTQPPVQLEFGWWSLFKDSEGTRFALVPLGQ